MKLHLLPVGPLVLLASGCLYTLAPPVSVSDAPPTRTPNAGAVVVPEGYRVSVVASGLVFPSGITVDASGTPWVVEAGYSYGEVFTEPRLLRITGDGTWEVVATGEDAPWTGVDAADGALFVVEGGSVDGGSLLRVTPEGTMTTLVTGLPGMGDHHTNGPVVRDGHVYFGQGTATNSAVVGIDNYDFGWLERRPSHHDVPCTDVRVTDATWKTQNPLTEERDSVVTGPYAPFGEVRGGDIPGELPCTGAVMRVPTAGGPLELVAWGFRNPFGLAFSDDGRLWVTDNGYDARGSRPVRGAGDWLWAVTPGTWYGWPDYAGGKPLHSRTFAQSWKPAPKPILAELPAPFPTSPSLTNLGGPTGAASTPAGPPSPAATFGVHASADGITFAPDTFGFGGEAFVAEFGDMAPSVGKVLAQVGRRVVRVDTATGVIAPFATTATDAIPGTGLERPVDVAFSPDGTSLYVLDFGVMAMVGKEAHPVNGTGVVWRVERTGEAGQAEEAPLPPLEARGQVAFARHCYSCHPDAGAGMGPSALLPPHSFVPLQVRLGLGAMPAFTTAELPRDDLRAIVAWLAWVDESNNRP